MGILVSIGRALCWNFRQVLGNGEHLVLEGVGILLCISVEWCQKWQNLENFPKHTLWENRVWRQELQI